MISNYNLISNKTINFINVKVDREERPDVDQVYMNAVQLMTGSGGWPLNAVALPDGRPVWGGTYFKKEKDILDLYKSIGDSLKNNFSGFDAWILSSSRNAMKNVGLKTSKRLTLFNGALECKYHKYSEILQDS